MEAKKLRELYEDFDAVEELWRLSPTPTQLPQKRRRLDPRGHRIAPGRNKESSLFLIPKTRLQALPLPLRTPSPSRSTASPPPENMLSPHRKRSRDGDGDSTDFTIDLEATPKADRSRLQGQGPPSDWADQRSLTSGMSASSDHSTRSAKSRKSSSAVSRRSSLVKQQRNAALQDTGFESAGFEMGAERLPLQLAQLTEDLTKIGFGVSILPHNLQAEACLTAPLDSHKIPPFAFRQDQHADDFNYSYPDSAFIRDILLRADKCLRDLYSEASWNVEVHKLVLDWVLRIGSPYREAFIDSMYCPSAQISSAFKPEDAPSKMVDFCIFVQTPRDSPEHERIIQLCKSSRPSQSINHTESGSLFKDPIAISIETKRHGENWDEAMLQMGIWHAAQLRSIAWTPKRRPPPPAPGYSADLGHGMTSGPWLHSARRIEFVPGIIIQGHTWKFVATVRGREGERPILYDTVPLGDTQSAFGVLRLVVALQRLKFWARDGFWPAFRSEVLGFGGDVLAV
ncbi:uncharacterized protein BCR38DRAFT_484117 [Pseudomassariella vexata]|uniref:PD-(D/E)XK nuclease-like domain-containing protein n=1 Tax=Pseudomassariella vexata TaxID=1141098 RepID=A0A1Y2E4Q1_9PEZI|nr:uncharacterized protein BCR38DRAFT_484117 [Pseudomassariella vexata]ORY66499.1 hypothetical protein BCR38DRAFT_484117 [Pseudomassariella vexata]